MLYFSFPLGVTFGHLFLWGWVTKIIGGSELACIPHRLGKPILKGVCYTKPKSVFIFHSTSIDLCAFWCAWHWTRHRKCPSNI